MLEVYPCGNGNRDLDPRELQRKLHETIYVLPAKYYPALLGVLLVYCESHNEFKISLKPDEPGFPVEVPLR